jgi:hypothetical protein
LLSSIHKRHLLLSIHPQTPLCLQILRWNHAIPLLSFSPKDICTSLLQECFSSSHSDNYFSLSFWLAACVFGAYSYFIYIYIYIATHTHTQSIHIIEHYIHI